MSLFAGLFANFTVHHSHFLSFKEIMADKTKFIETVKAGYIFKSEAYKIGCAVLEGEVVSDAAVFLPLKTMNRHGLIAGATGTG